MKAQTKKGLVEVAVLSAICGEASYGYKILQDISPYVPVSESALYPILRRLEQAGALTTYSA
ncbi:MAG: PadR family transcriptional regulator, partial [Christensenellaceae bacterium]|nr:PadR family transcriptional regulator [Christensenellaceae bacterium]